MRRISLAWLLILMPIAASGSPKAAYVWNGLADGLSYATYSFSISEKERTSIHAFQIDPKKFRMDVVTAADEKLGDTAEELAKRDKALIVINGGFFTPEHTSIGLIVKNGRTINPIHNTSWWSLFAIIDGKPQILRPSQFRSPEGVQMALQVGPRLVIDGNIPKLKENVATRSAVGITRDGMITIAITSGHGISMGELARRMALSRWQGGLECIDAMALDGGSSSQMYARIGDFEFSQPGLAKITNGLAVFPK